MTDKSLKRRGKRAEDMTTRRIRSVDAVGTKYQTKYKLAKSLTSK